MNKRKLAKITALAVAASVALAGCTSGGGGDSGADSKGAVAMSFPGLDVQIWVDMLDQMKPIVEEAGYDFVTDDPQWDIQRQVSNWQSWIQRGDIKAIMGFPVQLDSVIPVTDEANAAGIPVIGYVNKWDGTAAALYIDNYEDGFVVGEEAGKWIKENYGSTETTVALMSFPDNEFGLQRGGGIVAGLESSGANFRLSEMKANNIQEGMDQAKRQLTAEPNTRVWLSVGADATLGTYRALIEHGVAPDDSEYLLGGLDTTNEILDIVKDPDSFYRLAYGLSVEELAQNCAALLISAADSGSAKDITMSSTRVTPENVDAFRTGK